VWIIPLVCFGFFLGFIPLPIAFRYQYALRTMMEVIKMTGVGSILWIIAIVVFFYFMIREGGVCSDGNEHDHETDKEKFGGGCCG